MDGLSGKSGALQLVGRVAAVDLQGPGCRIAVSLVDDALRVGHGGVVDEHFDAILGCQQGGFAAGRAAG
jgi:hypothetical protein